MASEHIAQHIRCAERRVVYVAPGLTSVVAEALLYFAMHERGRAPVVVVENSDDVCRLGYGEVRAIRRLFDHGLPLLHCRGLRVGLLICDGEAWSFTPTPLAIEDEPRSSEALNAVRLLPEQADELLCSIAPSLLSTTPTLEFDPPVGGMRTEPVVEKALAAAEASLEVAPPQRFDVQRQVRVFQSYIQYVELRLTGCSITRRKVPIPTPLVPLTRDSAMQERLNTTFNLIGHKSGLSDRPLQDELEEIRRVFTRSLGQPWGRIMLRSQRDKLDARLAMLRTKVERYREAVAEKLEAEIERSVRQLAGGLLPVVKRRPPLDLLAQVAGDKPTDSEAKRWIEVTLRSAFPRVQEVVSGMELECVFKDVTYENLNTPGLREALQVAYPLVEWDKPFHEFAAAQQRLSL